MDMGECACGVHLVDLTLGFVFCLWAHCQTLLLSWFSFSRWFHSSQAGLELSTLLPQPLKCCILVDDFIHSWLAINSQPSCLSLSSVAFTTMCYYPWLFLVKTEHADAHSKTVPNALTRNNPHSHKLVDILQHFRMNEYWHTHIHR